MNFKQKILNFLDKYKDKKSFIFIKNLLFNLKEDDISGTSAEVTYYLLLSLFPFLMFFLNILSYTPVADEAVLRDILIFLPDDSYSVIEKFIKEIVATSSNTLLSLSIFLALWSGSSGVVSLIKSINKAYNVKEKRPFILIRLLSIFFTLAIALLIIIVLVMLVFGEAIIRDIFLRFNATTLFIKLWRVLSMVIPIVFMILTFSLLYGLSVSPNPRFKLKLKETLPGSIITSIGWIVASYIFSFYVNNFGNFSKTYGSLGGIFALILWLYMTSFLIILGGEINGTYKELKLKK